MNKMETAAEIILQGVLELLAKTHGVNVDAICEGLHSGNVKLMAQFKQCAEAGAAAATTLAAQGKISLI